MMKLFKKIDWLSLLSMLALIAIGTVAIWSAGHARTEIVFHNMWKQNLLTAGIGLVLYAALAFSDYRKWIDWVAPIIYAVSLVFLVAVLLFGAERFGGRRWLWFFQPSEVSKICIITLIASWFGVARPTFFSRRFGVLGFILAMITIGVPILLILAEPDLGTALTLIPAVLVMLLVAGVWRNGLVIITAICGIGALLLLGAVYEAERPGIPAERREQILRYIPLKDHQLRRVRVFLFPERDRRGAGYNLQQSLIAIGSGGFSGKGIGQSDASHLKYLPQAISMNDFIFCVYAEETGFVGATILLALFALLLMGGCRVAFVANDGRGRLLALGVTTLIFAHVYINIAMSIGVVPITGLPLPFVSAGRTFLIVAMCGLGCIQSVSINQEEKVK